MSARPFRRRSALQHWELRFGPNMTPMVDIVMVILVFFMASAAFVGPEFFLRSALPQTGAGPEAVAADPFDLPPVSFDIRVRVEGARTVVSGLGAGTLTLDQFEAELDALAAGGAADSMVLLIHPDPDAPYADVVRVHDACAKAGVRNAGLAR